MHLLRQNAPFNTSEELPSSALSRASAQSVHRSAAGHVLHPLTGVLMLVNDMLTPLKDSGRADCTVIQSAAPTA